VIFVRAIYPVASPLPVNSRMALSFDLSVSCLCSSRVFGLSAGQSSRRLGQEADLMTARHPSFPLHWTGSSRFSLLSMATALAAAPGQ